MKRTAVMIALLATGCSMEPRLGRPDPAIPAAGALADNTTIERARAIGLDAEDFLRRSDAYSFFHALGDDVVTGPTGTNVRDVRILMASS